MRIVLGRMLNLPSFRASHRCVIGFPRLASFPKRLETLEAKTTASAAEEGAPDSFEEERYWAAASYAESLIALSDKAGPELLQQAISTAPSKWMADVTLKQLAKLQTLLAGMQQNKRPMA
jgi:hypothetical protein